MVSGETATQFAWRTLALGDYPSLGAPGPDVICWLCAGPTGGVGWPWREAIPPTYTNHTLARVPTSTTVCQACAALGSKATWERYVQAHPEQKLKTGHAMSWRCYSHLFTESGHECPSRARWRELLLDPPEPPFLAVIALSGQKHLIFRGQVAQSRDQFPVRLEEDVIWCQRQGFAACLADVEQLLALGCSLTSVLTGRYHPEQLRQAGSRVWRIAEPPVARWRQRAPHWLQLAVYVAYRPGKEEEGAS